MRQRYLLGRYNRHRYTEEYKFLSQELTEEVYMQSTDVNRTLQSGYSELMGLYPPGESDAPQLTQGEVDSLSGAGRPPFRVRDAEQIN